MIVTAFAQFFFPFIKLESMRFKRSGHAKRGGNACHFFSITLDGLWVSSLRLKSRRTCCPFFPSWSGFFLSAAVLLWTQPFYFQICLVKAGANAAIFSKNLVKLFFYFATVANLSLQKRRKCCPLFSRTFDGFWISSLRFKSRGNAAIFPSHFLAAIPLWNLSCQKRRQCCHFSQEL